MPAFPPIAELIPHSGPMVLLDALTAWAPGEATATLRIREGTPFVRDGRVHGSTTLEHMAQCVAACLGYEALQGGEGVRVGMIIACKRMQLHAEHLHVGDRGVVQVRRIRGNQTLSHFDASLQRNGSPFADAMLTLFHGETPP